VLRDYQIYLDVTPESQQVDQSWMVGITIGAT